MTKTVCDFCGETINMFKQMYDDGFEIHRNGQMMDVCADCAKKIKQYIKTRPKKGGEDK